MLVHTKANRQWNTLGKVFASFQDKKDPQLSSPNKRTLHTYKRDR